MVGTLYIEELKMKTLIIDDSRAARFMISKIMQEYSSEILEAEDGKVALEKIRANPDIDIALVDWNMPVMSGIEFVTEVRKDSRFDHVKMMMVTTETEMSQVVRALSEGANEYVMKPFTKEVIEEKLKILELVP